MITNPSICLTCEEDIKHCRLREDPGQKSCFCVINHVAPWGGADMAQEILNLQTDTLGSWNVGPLLAS